MAVQVSAALLRYALLAAELVEIESFSVDVAVFPDELIQVDAFSVDVAVFPAEHVQVDAFSVDVAVFPTAATVVTAQRIDMAVPLQAIDVSELRVDYLIEDPAEARLAELSVTYSFLPTGGAFELTNTDVEEEIFQIISVCDPIDRASWAVFPDQTFVGGANIYSVSSSYDTPLLGGTTVGADNVGFMVPIQTGPLTTSAVDLDLILTQSGSANTARWAWRETGNTDYMAQNSHKWFHSHHIPASGSDTSIDSSTLSYNEDSDILYWLRTDSANGYVRIYSRAASSGLTSWTLLTAFSPHRMTSKNVDTVKLVPLPDGAMLLYVWAGGDVDSYYSSDDGSTWTPYAMRIQALAGGSSAYTNAQMAVARSGSHIRVVFAESSVSGGPTVLPTTLHSSDWGLSWELLEDVVSNVMQPRSYANAPEVLVFTLVPLERADGGFFFAYVGSSDEVRVCVARAGDPWPQAATLTLADTFIGDTEAWSALTGYVLGDKVRLEGALVQTAGGGTDFPAYSGNWCAFEIPIDQPNSNSTTINHTVVACTRHSSDDGGAPTRLPFFATAVKAGEYIAYAYTRGETVTGTPEDFLVSYTGGWSTHPMATDVLDQDLATFDIFSVEYLPAFGTMAAGNWTPSGVAATQTSTYARFAPGAGQTSERTKDFGANPILIVQGAAAISQTTSFGGSFSMGAGTTGDVGLGFVLKGITIRNADDLGAGTDDSIELHVRLATTTTIQLYDATAGSILATIVVPDMTLSNVVTHYKCALSYNIATGNPEASIMATQDFTTWSTSVPAVVLYGAGGLATSTFGAGQFIAAGSAQQLDVHHLWLAALRGNMNILAAPGSSDIAGTPAHSYTLPTIGNMEVMVTGVAGLAGDTFTATQKSMFPPVNTLEDSPSIHWQSIAGGSSVDQTIIYYAGDLRFFDHTALALVGTVAQTATVDYSNDPTFAVIVDTVELDSTTFAAIPITTATLNGLVITEDGLNIARGELAGQIAVNTTANAAGYIVRHAETGTIILEDGSGNAIDVSAWSGSISVHAPRMIAKFDEIRAQYIRVTFAAQPTPGSDQRVGTAVFGNSFTLSFPLEWTHTVSEGANLSTYRTKSGVEFRHPEGTTQRTYSGRLVGDVVRERESLGNLLRHGANFGQRALYFVFNGERPHDYDAGMLCTWPTLRLDNIANTADSLKKVRDFGDTPVELQEVV